MNSKYILLLHSSSQKILLNKKQLDEVLFSSIVENQYKQSKIDKVSSPEARTSVPFLFPGRFYPDISRFFGPETFCASVHHI